MPVGRLLSETYDLVSYSLCSLASVLILPGGLYLLLLLVSFFGDSFTSCFLREQQSLIKLHCAYLLPAWLSTLLRITPCPHFKCGIPGELNRMNTPAETAKSTDISVNPKRPCAPFQSTSVLAAGNTGSFRGGTGDRLFRSLKYAKAFALPCRTCSHQHPGDGPQPCSTDRCFVPS